VSLADRVVATGETLVGAVALGNVAHNDYGGIVLSLVPLQTLRMLTTTQEIRGVGYPAHVRVEQPREGGAIPFRMRIPELPPTNASTVWKLEWRLEARAQRRYGRDLVIEMPLTIVARGSRASSATALAALRWAALIDALACRGGRATDGPRQALSPTSATLPAALARAPRNAGFRPAPFARFELTSMAGCSAGFGG
jgi:hypothetical protein